MVSTIFRYRHTQTPSPFLTHGHQYLLNTYKLFTTTQRVWLQGVTDIRLRKRYQCTSNYLISTFVNLLCIGDELTGVASFWQPSQNSTITYQMTKTTTKSSNHNQDKISQINIFIKPVMQANSQTDSQSYSQTASQTARQPDSQTASQTDRQTDRQNRSNNSCPSSKYENSTAMFRYTSFLASTQGQAWV